MVTIKMSTDGACSGNPGPGGFATIITCDDWGINETNAVAIYGGSPKTTNNKMELKGIFEGLNALQNIVSPDSELRKFISINANMFTLPKEFNPKDFHIKVFTDSNYCVQTFTNWWINWANNGWMNSKKEPVKNKDLISYTLMVSNGFGMVSYNWIKGHADNKYNNMCDELAVEAYKKELYDGLYYDIVNLA